MHWDVKAWYRSRVLKKEPLPDDLWRRVVERLRFLRGLNNSEIERLRECVTLFLHAKQISGAQGLIVTGEMRMMIGVQACVLILNLDLDYFDGWVEIIVYPGGFMRDYEYVDEDGVVHHAHEPASGASWLGGPVILSWEDAICSEADAGYNVVIHEFAHKLDMLNGDANGFPPLHADMSRQAWSEAFSGAYADFRTRVEAEEATALDSYAAENPAEFFAVMSEAFFQTPRVVGLHYPKVYEQLALFYRQDPAGRRDA
jgi:Mlc titration factor MtfA (ptsG expression regulator)